MSYLLSSLCVSGTYVVKDVHLSFYGLRAYMLNRKRIQRITKMLDSRYPNALRYAYLYSVPYFIRLFFYVVSRWMDPITGMPTSAQRRSASHCIFVACVYGLQLVAVL